MSAREDAVRAALEHVKQFDFRPMTLPQVLGHVAVMAGRAFDAARKRCEEIVEEVGEDIEKGHVEPGDACEVIVMTFKEELP